jgi:tRNA-dihydrouridine synthase
MAGYCDLAFRLVVRSAGGVGLAYTELINPRAIVNHPGQVPRLAQTCNEWLTQL